MHALLLLCCISGEWDMGSLEARVTSLETRVAALEREHVEELPTVPDVTILPVNPPATSSYRAVQVCGPNGCSIQYVPTGEAYSEGKASYSAPRKRGLFKRLFGRRR